MHSENGKEVPVTGEQGREEIWALWVETEQGQPMQDLEHHQKESDFSLKCIHERVVSHG